MMKTWIVLLMIFAASCTGAKKTMEKTDIETIMFGSGGGITGAAHVFMLKPDGTVAKEDRKRQYTTLGAIAKDKVVALFKKAEAIKHYRYNKPGNMYSFIDIVDASGNNHIVWTVPAEVDTNVVSLHKELTMLANSLNK